MATVGTTKSGAARIKPVSVKFEPHDLETVRTMARDAGLKLSEYLRWAALREAQSKAVPLYPLQRPLAELTAILLQLRRRLADPRKFDGIELMHLEIHVSSIKRLVKTLIRISDRRVE